MFGAQQQILETELNPTTLNGGTGTMITTSLPAQILQNPGHVIQDLRPSDNALTVRDVTAVDPDDLFPFTQAFAMGFEEELAYSIQIGKPLVIVIGENHDIPAQHMCQIIALDVMSNYRARALAAGQPAPDLIFAYEQPYNLYQKLARDGLKLRVPNTLYYRDNLDPDGHRAMSVMLSKNLHDRIPLSFQHVFKAAIQQQIPVLFNDAAREYDWIGRVKINENDTLFPTITKSLKDDFAASDRDLSPTSPYGMAYRDFSMSQRVMRKITQFKDTTPTDPKLITLQHCGLCHIFGHRLDKTNLQHTLAARYRDAGAHVWPIFFATYNYTPERVVGKANETSVWQDFPNTSIFRGFNEEEHSAREKEQECFSRLEAAYARAVERYRRPLAPFHSSLFPPNTNLEIATVQAHLDSLS